MLGNCLVTGATGFIGYEVVRQLARRGLKPRCMIRRLRRGTVLSGLDVDFVVADLERPESLQRAVNGVDTVFHLAGRATFEPYDRLKPSMVDGSKALMQAAADHGVKRFVFASSLMVYGNTKTPIDRETPTAPFVDYGRAKRECETAMREIAASAGMSCAAIRLPHVYGATDLVFTDLLRRDLLISPGSEDKPYGHMHVEDAARVLVACAEQAFHGALPVADDMNATWKEVFGVIERHYPRARKLTIPPWLAIAGVSLLLPYQYLFNRQTLYTADAIRSWDASLPVEPGVLWEELGMRPNYPTIHEGIPAVLDACVKRTWRHPLHDSC
ncbi:MAG: NAD-dependent epimerase/dehydratase family protein [Oceanidesulfovibrio sp.]